MTVGKLKKNFQFVESEAFESKWKNQIIETLSSIEKLLAQHEYDSCLNKIRKVLEYIILTYFDKYEPESLDEYKEKGLKASLDYIKWSGKIKSKVFFNVANGIRITTNTESHAQTEAFKYELTALDIVSQLKNLYSIFINLFGDEKTDTFDFDPNVYLTANDIKKNDNVVAIIHKKMDECTNIDNDLIINQNTIREWLTIPQSQLKIPIYQRKYEWTEENIRVLFNDIKSRTKDLKSHYFGTIAQKKEAATTNYGKNKIKIIDGQQRITTSIIIICATRDLLIHKYKKNIDDIDWLEPIWNNGELVEYIWNPGGTSENNSAFRSVISNIKDIEKKLNDSSTSKNNFFKNYYLFYKKLDEEFNNPYDIELFIRVFLNQFVVAGINFDSRKYPMNCEMEIFENLNSKGVELHVNDLIKNYIFNLANEDFLNSKEEAIAKRYNSMLSNHGLFDKVENLFEFYSSIAEISEGVEISSKRHEQFSTIKNSLNEFFNISEKSYSENEFYSLLDEIESFIKIYKTIIDSNSTNDIINYFKAGDKVQYITNAKKKKHFVYFVYIIKLWIENKFKIKIRDDLKVYDKKLEFTKEDFQYVQRLLLEMSKFLIRTQIITIQGDSGIKRKIIEIAHQMYINYKNYNSLKELCSYGISLIEEACDSNSPYSYEKFKVALEENLKETQVLPLLMLTEDCMTESITGIGESVQRTFPSTEHIMPQNIDKWLKQIPDADKASYESDHKRYLNRIGNFLILTTKGNSKIKDNPFAYKKEHVYSKLVSPLYDNKKDPNIDISSKTQWTFEDIQKRSKAIVDYILANVIKK